ncbi:MAG: hypothetical protein ACHP85_14675 [Burkholderiales bacterium]|jgi:hypothetical protein
MRAKLSEKLTAAVDLALKGDWQGAHLVAQEHEGDELANWLHAVAHRMEGDLGNARYWYGRCGRQLREDVPVATELRELRAALEKA